jgi:hypothetical protein
MSITIDNQCQQGVDIVAVTTKQQKQTITIKAGHRETIQTNSVDTVSVEVNDNESHYDVKAHNNGTSSTNLRLFRMGGGNGKVTLAFI